MNSAYDFIIWIYLNAGNFDTVIFVLPIIIMVCFIYWIARFIWHKQKFGVEFSSIRKKSRLNEGIRLLTVCWLCALLCITLAPTEFWMHFWKCIVSGVNPFDDFLTGRFADINLIPKVLKYILDGHLDWLFWSAKTIFTHLLLNILLFIPLGIALPFVYSKASLPKTALIALLLSFFIETVQFFLARECDIDDLICNVLGAVFGYLLYLLLKKLFPNFIKKCKLSASSLVSKGDSHNSDEKVDSF